ILDVQKRVDDAAGKTAQTVDWRGGLARIYEMEPEGLLIRRSMKHLVAGVGINSSVLLIKRVDRIVVQHPAIAIGIVAAVLLVIPRLEEEGNRHRNAHGIGYGCVRCSLVGKLLHRLLR